MQKLSRINKYRDYRNELNNGGEREIATKELRELQEKIIFNEKRFGSSSKTEADLNRGRRDTTFDSFYNHQTTKDDVFNDYSDNGRSSTNDLDDIFSELNKYKNVSSHSKEIDEQDDYIKRIKEIVSSAGTQNVVNNDYQESPFEDTKPIEKPRPVEKPTPRPQQFEDKSYAEFDEPLSKPEQPKVKSQIKNVVLEKPEIKPIIPQADHSKEFKEICEAVNSLAEEIEESSSFAQAQYTPQPKKRMPETSLEGMQQTIKKDLINSDDSFMENLKQEVEQYNKAEEAKKVEEVKEEIVEEKKEVKMSEVSGQMKQEFDNTISIEVSKLVNEIKSSKADSISTDDIIKETNIAKKNISNDQSGKTIAFELNKNDIPDNTIVLSKPDLDDSSIHTMSFKTEELDVEDERSNTLLNIILSILIIIAVGALGVIIYFFLITRGII